MSNRLQALFRLVILLPAYLVLLVLSPIMLLLAAGTFLVDIVLQLVTGGRGLTPGSSPFTKVFNLYRQGLNYVIYGG